MFLFSALKNSVGAVADSVGKSLGGDKLSSISTKIRDKVEDAEINTGLIEERTSEAKRKASRKKTLSAVAPQAPPLTQFDTSGGLGGQVQSRQPQPTTLQQPTQMITFGDALEEIMNNG